MRGPRLGTLVVLCGLAFIGVVRAATPVLPPSFPKPITSAYSARGEIRFEVRIVPHPDLVLLTAEAWDLQPVSWSESFPFVQESDRQPDEPAVRYEPAGNRPVRSSDEPLPAYPQFQKVEGPDGKLIDETYQQWRDRVNPRSLYPFTWKEGLLVPGKYDLRAKVRTKGHATVSASRRIEVM